MNQLRAEMKRASEGFPVATVAVIVAAAIGPLAFLVGDHTKVGLHFGLLDLVIVAFSIAMAYRLREVLRDHARHKQVLPLLLSPVGGREVAWVYGHVRAGTRSMVIATVSHGKITLTPRLNLLGMIGYGDAELTSMLAQAAHEWPRATVGYHHTYPRRYAVQPASLLRA
jgi:hypothetical protein